MDAVRKYKKMSEPEKEKKPQGAARTLKLCKAEQPFYKKLYKNIGGKFRKLSDLPTKIKGNLLHSIVGNDRTLNCRLNEIMGS